MATRHIDARHNPSFTNIVGGYHDSGDIINYYLSDTPLDDETQALNTDGSLGAIWNNIFDDTLQNTPAITNLFVSSHRIVNRLAEKVATAGFTNVKVSTKSPEMAPEAANPLYKYSNLGNNNMAKWSDFGVAFNGAKWSEVAVHIDGN